MSNPGDLAMEFGSAISTHRATIASTTSEMGAVEAGIGGADAAESWHHTALGVNAQSSATVKKGGTQPRCRAAM